jgi:hypothetical protein
MPLDAGGKIAYKDPPVKGGIHFQDDPPVCNICKQEMASIMASATPFCFCTTQKHLAVTRARSSRA